MPSFRAKSATSLDATGRRRWMAKSALTDLEPSMQTVTPAVLWNQAVLVVAHLIVASLTQQQVYSRAVIPVAE